MLIIGVETDGKGYPVVNHLSGEIDSGRRGVNEAHKVVQVVNLRRMSYFAPQKNEYSS